MPNTWRLSKYKLLAICALISLISAALLIFTSSPSQGETIIGTVGKPGAVGTAYNLVDADYSAQFTQDGLLDWQRTLAYRAGKGTSQYNRPQTVSVIYQVFGVYRGETRLVGSRKVSVNLGKTKQYAYTPRAYMFVENFDSFGFGNGYYVKTYVSWKNNNSNTLIAARTFAQNDLSDYRCVDYNSNGGTCEKTTFTNGNAFVRIFSSN